MVNQLNSIFGFKNLKVHQIKSKLDSIISKHPYFHLAQLYRLQLNKRTPSNQKYLSQVAVNTYHRSLLKHCLEKELTEEKSSTAVIEKESVKSKKIDDLIDMPDSTRVVRSNPTPSVYGKVDLSKNRLVQTNEVFTETLAELYLKQHQYQKAIEVLTFILRAESEKFKDNKRNQNIIIKSQTDVHHFHCSYHSYLSFIDFGDYGAKPKRRRVVIRFWWSWLSTIGGCPKDHRFFRP